jgi:hypothetical protein
MMRLARLAGGQMATILSTPCRCPPKDELFELLLVIDSRFCPSQWCSRTSWLPGLELVLDMPGAHGLYGLASPARVACTYWLSWLSRRRANPESLELSVRAAVTAPESGCQCTKTAAVQLERRDAGVAALPVTRRRSP